MHGLVNRSIQLFVTETRGKETWAIVTRVAGIDFVEFEGMMRYKEVYTHRLLNAAAEVLNRPRHEIMEDLGTFIVSQKGFEAVRRLLRFGGIDFVDFLHSLDDLSERVRLAISDLKLPQVELRSHSEGEFSLHCDASFKGYGYVMMGVLRAMADDYGVLALLEHRGRQGDREIVSIRLVETDYSEGREFELGAASV